MRNFVKKMVSRSISPPTKPHMSDEELVLLKEFTPSGAVLEFGCGGSSIFFLDCGVSSLTSVESDIQWINTLKQIPEMRTCLDISKWRPYHVNIGPTQEWGYPTQRRPHISWLNYHQYIWDEIGNTNFDMVLIDGRFRVACTLQSILRVANDSTTFIIHDFWNREIYHSVLNFCEEIAKVDTLAILRAKRNVDWKKLSLILQRHQFDYR